MKAELPEAYGSPALATSPVTHDPLCSPQAPSPQTILFPLSSHEESTFFPYRNHPASKVKLKILCRGSLRFSTHPFPSSSTSNTRSLAPGTPQHPPPHCPLWHSPLYLTRLTTSNRRGLQGLDPTSPGGPAQYVLRTGTRKELDKSNSPPSAALIQPRPAVLRLT